MENPTKKMSNTETGVSGGNQSTTERNCNKL